MKELVEVVFVQMAENKMPRQRSLISSLTLEGPFWWMLRDFAGWRGSIMPCKRKDYARDQRVAGANTNITLTYEFRGGYENHRGGLSDWFSLHPPDRNRRADDCSLTASAMIVRSPKTDRRAEK